MAQPERIAFLGLGAMGFGMATNLLGTYPVVTGFDVYAPTLDRFAAAGGETASTPREAVKGARYVVFMVATAAQILSALFGEGSGAVGALEDGATLLLCSTGPPGYAADVKARLEGAGRGDVGVVDVAVSGGTLGAWDGTLSIFASGTEEVLEEGKRLLDAMAGKNLWIIPGGLGAGTNVKMVHQVLAAIQITMASEAMGFVAALGLDSKWAFERLRESEGSSWMFENRVPHMLIVDEKVYSALNIITKDVGIVNAGGRGAGVPLFLSSAAEQVIATGIRAGFGFVDDAQLVRVYLPKEPNLVLEQAGSVSIASQDDLKLKLVVQVMAAVHLVSAMEAMSLGAKVGLDTKQLFDICAGAAGTSWMFKDRVPQLLSGNWTSKATVDEVVAGLVVSIEEANKIKYPLHLASTALQLLQLVALRGFGKEPDVAIYRIWDVAGGPLFPAP